MKKMAGLVIFFTIFLGACGIIEDVVGSFNDEITFGTGNMDDGIEEEKSTFSPDEDFLMELNLSEPFGVTDISYVLLQDDDGAESIVQEWDDTVDPNWDWMVVEFHNMEYDSEYEPGEYILRIYDADSDMVAEGEFSIE